MITNQSTYTRRYQPPISNPETKKYDGFLGTMAGRQCYMTTKDSNQYTYVRKYDPFGGSDDLRSKVAKVGDSFGAGYKELGEEYSYTPINYSDGRDFGSRPGTMQGGGFFLTVKTFQGQAASLNCFAYALSTYGESIENATGKSMKDIQDSVNMSIDHIVKEYFQSIEVPKDGDLVVYQTIESTVIGSRLIDTHAGIYRETKRNWNSPSGGSVESKWGWLGGRVRMIV